MITDTIGFIVFLIVAIIVLILHYAMYSWTTELEKAGCECSNLWHRNFIHIIALILMIVVVIKISLKILEQSSLQFKYKDFTIFFTPFVILMIIYIAIIYDYIAKLKVLQCECSENWKRDFGYISSIVYISIYSLIALMLLIIIILFIFYYKDIIKKYNLNNYKM